MLNTATALITWMLTLTAAQVAGCLAGSLLVSVLVGHLRIVAVAAALHAAREAEWERVAEAAQAAEKSLLWTAEELCRGMRPPLPAEPGWEGSGSLIRVLELISNLQVQGAASLLRVHDESQAAVLVSMHHTLTRRQHALIGQMLEHLTQLQHATEDPVLLDHSFKIDHLATRLRRMVESVCVVLGGTSLRETRAPVPVSTVLRGAKSEVLRYARVSTAGGQVGSAYALPAHVHPDVTHLLAELIDNALEHSDPATKVLVRAEKVNAGLHLEVEDRATLLMDPGQREKLNTLLAQPGSVDVAEQVRRGSLGLVTAAKIAERHGLRVWLTVNPTGGTTANVVVPNHFLVPSQPVIGTLTVPSTAPPAPGPGAPDVTQPAVSGTPTPATAAASGPSPQDGAPEGRLPRRERAQRPMPTQVPAAPAPTANPRAAADWRIGLHHGLTADGPSPTQP
ncbi:MULTISPECIES: ATP-binding protein [unclassified Streptomyces]|uniref:sensor histidine kinase n=1 Tax=unclassified Streptomyces TaxID=2593676 RepID=UPI0036E26FE0